MTNQEGYLDYKMICEEMDELMKYAPEARGPCMCPSVFEYPCYYEFCSARGRERAHNNYFEEVMDRVVQSTSGPRDERIALFVVSALMTSNEFFHRGRIEKHSIVYFDIFHKRMHNFLQDHVIGDEFISHEIEAESYERILLEEWDKRIKPGDPKPESSISWPCKLM